MPKLEERSQSHSGRLRALGGIALDGVSIPFIETPGIVPKVIGGVLFVAGSSLIYSTGRDLDLGKGSTRKLFQRIKSRNSGPSLK